MANKIIQKNKTGLFNYKIMETYQAGLVLTGPEVKSAKGGHLSLHSSYISIDNHNEAWLVGCYISPYKPAGGIQTNYQPERRRKLLLNKKEIDTLMGKTKQKGLTIIPVSVYTTKGLIKVDIALARGKTKVDKRANIKKREIDRQIRRSLKN